MAMPLQSVLHPFFLPALFVSQFDTLEIQLNGKLGSNTDEDSEGIAYAHLLWSIPGGSSSSCFCCDFLLDQRPLADSIRALTKFVQCLFLLFLSALSFFLFFLFLPSLWPPHLIHPPIRSCILSGRRHGARGARTAASSCCFCCCPLVRFFLLFFFADIPL